MKLQDTWPRCERLLPHAQFCATLIADYAFTFPQAARLLNQTAYYLEYFRASYLAALPLYQRALAIREQVLGPEHPDTATSLNNLAGLYQSQGNSPEALALYQRALAISEKLLRPDHPHTSVIRENSRALQRQMQPERQ